MTISNSNLSDIDRIFELYNSATDYMNSKKGVAWPKFKRDMIINEIENKLQWKLEIDKQIACIWAITLNDELIWGIDSNPSLYVHRLATNPKFRGNRLAGHVFNWCHKYCIENKLNYIKMDTVGLNKGLINHYSRFGFDFLGTKKLKNTKNLPEHYKKDVVCLFQKEIKETNSKKT